MVKSGVVRRRAKWVSKVTKIGVKQMRYGRKNGEEVSMDEKSEWPSGP